ncbi:MAG: hypothetical protein ACLQME_16290 [Alphaproteobacteria bacterium]
MANTQLKQKRAASEQKRGDGTLAPAEEFASAMSNILRSIANGYGANKRLAPITDRHPTTIGRYRHGSCPKAWYDLVRLAGSYPEVLELVLRRSGRHDLAERARESASEKNLDGALPKLLERIMVKLAGEAVGDRWYWATDVGDIEHAPAGHAEFARRKLGLSKQNPADQPSYVMRNLGWIAITLGADRSVTLAYNDLAVDGVAATRAYEWLLAEQHTITSVRRRVEVDERWIEATHPNVASALAALEILPSMGPRRRDFKWRTERLSLDHIKSKRIGSLLGATRLAGRQPGRLPQVAARLGLLDFSGLFRVEGDNVTSLWVGTHHGLFRSYGPTVMGKNLRERADLRYAEMVRLHVLGAVEEPEGTYYHNVVSIDGRGLEYLRLALADPADRDGAQLVLTTTEIIKEIPLANDG